MKTIIGKNENLRFINLALCQNDGKATAVPDMQMQASGNIHIFMIFFLILILIMKKKLIPTYIYFFFQTTRP